MREFKEGDVINNRYRVEGLLGKGGFSQVYKVYDIQAKKLCALKVLKEETAEIDLIIQRFKKEANLLQDLHHPNIIQIYDVYISDNLIYYVMECLEGKDLAEFLAKNKAQNPGWALAILTQLLRAISFMHKKGILHRDLKPSNIFLLAVKSKEFPQIKVIDLGIAKVLDSNETSTINEVLGTPLFMAPERLEYGDGSCSSDIYSIGEVLWQILTGEERCKSMRVTTMIAYKSRMPELKDIKNNSESIKSGKKDLVLLKEWLGKVLHPEPKLRFQTCEQALDFLEKPGIRFRMRLKKRLWRATVILVMLIVIAGAIYFSRNFYIEQLTKLHALKTGTTTVTGLDSNGGKLWEFEASCRINNATIMKDISPALEDTVLITTGNSDVMQDDPKAQPGQIWLLNSKGQKIWMQQLGKEWIPGTGNMYTASFWRAEDLDNNERKELLFTASHLFNYPDFLIILRPDNGTYYGVLWNPGDALQGVNVWQKDSKKYLSLVLTNQSLETMTIAWWAVDKPFLAFAPGWSERHTQILEKATRLSAKISHVYPQVTIRDMIPKNPNRKTNWIENREGTGAVVLHADQSDFAYNWEGYPLNESGLELYPRKINALSPTEFLWQLNPYYTRMDKKLFQEAAQLCKNLIPKTPNIPQFNALIYMLMGKAQLRQGEIHGAIGSFKISLAVKPEGNRARVHLAEALILEKRLEEAEKLLTENLADMISLDFGAETKKFILYIYFLRVSQTKSAGSIDWDFSLLKKDSVITGYLVEQQLLYQGDALSRPVENYFRLEQTEKFWRWRIAREVLLQKKPLKESWNQVPASYYEDSGLAAIRYLVESGFQPEGLIAIEKSARGDIEDYLFLPAVYMLYSHEASQHNDAAIAQLYARKALQSNALGFLRIRGSGL